MGPARCHRDQVDSGLCSLTLWDPVCRDLRASNREGANQGRGEKGVEEPAGSAPTLGAPYWAPPHLSSPDCGRAGEEL